MLRNHQQPQVSLRNIRELPYKYIDQRVDNFNQQNLATFRQAYFENDEFFATDGPMFIFVGGEWAIHPALVLAGHFVDMAKENNGSIFYPEHRFYGHSFPTEDASTENLRLLSVQQSLADLANFIAQIKRQQPRYARSKVILAGGSYSGLMVAWFQKKYPHLVTGVWASSAPILAKVNFEEFSPLVGQSIRTAGGPSCYDRIERAFAQAEQLIAREQFLEFSTNLGFCKDFGEHPLDAPSALYFLTVVLGNKVMYNNNHQIADMCEELEQAEDSSDIAALGRVVRNHFGLPEESDYCFSNYWSDVLRTRNESLHSDAVQSTTRQWIYQLCTELGWFQSSDAENHPFGSSTSTELFYNICADTYGHHFTQQFVNAAIDRTNTVFGGVQLQVNNVYFSNGLLDPWRVLSIQQDLNHQSPAVLIPNAAHCEDLASISDADSVEMRESKKFLSTLVKIWLWLH